MSDFRMPTNRATLDAQFRAEAVNLLGEITPEIARLIARLTMRVPEMAFEPLEPRNRHLLLGEIDCEVADEFIRDIWAFHYYTPDIEVPLEIHLSSNGGDLHAGQAMIATLNDIRRQGRRVHVHVTGEACSMAFEILQAADHRSIEPFGTLMLHEEQEESVGSTTTRLTEAKFSKLREKEFFSRLAQRTGRTLEFYQKKSAAKDWFVLAGEALSEGLVDEVLSIPSLAKSPYRRVPRKKKQPDAE